MRAARAHILDRLGHDALFRQTGVFQPFLFLLASMALVALARRFHRLGQGVILVGLGALVISGPCNRLLPSSRRT